MQGEAGRQYTANSCSFLEINHFEDKDVKMLFAGRITSSRLLEAADLVRKKEKSPLLKLNLNIESDEDVDCIENLQSVLEIA
ncbi:MAG: hypothetical protein ACI4XJ_10025 [Eubacteriales bacterium]